MIVWIAGIAVALILLVLLGLVLFSWWTAHQVETNLPPRGKFIDIDGVRLHYIDKGSGPTLLLIHGLAGQVLNFTHSLLGRLTRDFRVVILVGPAAAIRCGRTRRWRRSPRRRASSAAFARRSGWSGR
jgi:hypothetical protein